MTRITFTFGQTYFRKGTTKCMMREEKEIVYKWNDEWNGDWAINIKVKFSFESIIEWKFLNSVYKYLSGGKLLTCGMIWIYLMRVCKLKKKKKQIFPRYLGEWFALWYIRQVDCFKHVLQVPSYFSSIKNKTKHF